MSLFEQETDAELSIEHNVIEHLGLKLYKNKIGNVLAELIANSWDADAENVYVDLLQDAELSISVSDDGHGMAFAEIRDTYLKVGKPKRGAGKSLSRAKNRMPMGRKGLGKLAPFGIARLIIVTSIADGKVTRFTLPLDAILDAGNGTYKPIFSLVDIPIDNIQAGTFGSKVDTFFARLNTLGKKQGTLIEMSNITLNDLPQTNNLLMEIGKRFTVVLLNQDFGVKINDTLVDADNALPSFELRIPSKGTTTVDIPGGKKANFWVGFVESADWPSDQAGVGVFAHGKIAQTRPFFFGRKGKEVFQRYLYGVVEADWIDDGDTDKISTDRTAIDWSDAELKPLLEWGKKSVGAWIDQYEKHRKDKSRTKVEEQAEILRREGRMKRYSESENKQIAQLVDDATAPLGKAPTANKAREELLIAVSKAWINAPSRELLKGLWSDLAKTNAKPESFKAIVEKMSDFSVPEGMGLAMNFAQRAYALTVLYELVHDISETNLQLLVENFPWILSPRGDLLTANQTLKTTVNAAADKLGDDKSRVASNIRGLSESLRADFVFLTDSEMRIIDIVEIKGPRVPLGNEERRQLTDYLDFISETHSGATVRGTLIGMKPDDLKSLQTDNRIVVKSWDEILRECRAIYVDMLAAMIKHSDIASNDTRTRDIVDFAGSEVTELLARLASKDDDLREIMESALKPTPKPTLL